MRVFRRALRDTWKFFGYTIRRVFTSATVFVIGAALGVRYLGLEKAMEEAHISVLYFFSPFIAIAFVVFLWNLWLAPYRLMDERIDELANRKGETPSRVNTTPADPSRWKPVQELELYKVAELCGGLSPLRVIEGSNDVAKAVYTELIAALRSGELKGSNEPEYAYEGTLIKRKDLQEYFKGRDDFPGFLKG